MTTELAVLIILAIGLAVASVLLAGWIFRIDAREKRLAARMNFVMGPLLRPLDPADDQISLAKSVNKSEKIKARAAELINVDLNRSEEHTSELQSRP